MQAFGCTDIVPVIIVSTDGYMGLFKFDVGFLLITAVVSLVATVAIIVFVNLMQPGLIVSTGGTAVFVYIGVFTANLIIEALHRRTRKD